MRTVRLGRTFDAVFIHDAICYMTDERQLRAAIATAAAHTRPGGVCLLAPDATREIFEPRPITAATTIRRRGAACATSCGPCRKPPAPPATRCTSRSSCAKPTARCARCTDQHTDGLFPRATWLHLLDECGFDATIKRSPTRTASAPKPSSGQAMKLYGELAEWWPLVSTRPTIVANAERYRQLLLAAAGDAPPREVLELGAGGGNNASHLKRFFALTLVDISPAMLAVSRALNPECAHVVGDMRTLRLGRTFDGVFVHDPSCT